MAQRYGCCCAAQLDQCLAALSCLNYPDYEVVVVDSAPTNARAREVALRWGVRYLTEPVPGLSRARNLGAHACETEIVAYLDDDAVPDLEWLTVLAQEFADPLVAVVTGAIVPTKPTRYRDERIAPATERGPRRVLDRNTPGWFELANFGELGDGSNMAFRRGAFDVWPGFNERLGRGTPLNGGEEHYAFFTLIERGYRVVYNPQSLVRHPDPCTTEELRRRHLNLLATTSAYITRLALEHPSCRRDLVRYLGDRLWTMSRPKSRNIQDNLRSLVPRWLKLFTLLSGPWIYLRSRMAPTNPARHESPMAKDIDKTPVASMAVRDETCRLES